MYHHVSPSAGMITTSPANFESQIAGLAKHGYRALSTSEFGAFMAGEPVPPKSILITFDDGYADNHDIALPILKRHGLTATFFIATGFLDGGRMWNDTVIEAVRRTKRTTLDLRGLFPSIKNRHGIGR